MYNVSIGPSKIVAKTRRGISQNLENLREVPKKSFEPYEMQVMNGPRLTFRSKKLMNGKPNDILSPQHEEIIKFISESWNKVFKEYETDTSEETFSTSTGSIIFYEEREPNPFLEDFKPFDLESWWGKRLFNNITNSIP